MTRSPLLTRLVGFIAMVAIWELLAYANADSGLIPHAGKVVAAEYQLLASGSILPDILWTLRRTVLGFGISVVLGIPIGILLGSIRMLDDLFGGWVTFFRSIPAFVVLPILLVVVQGGEAARVAMIAFGCFFVLAAYATMGTRRVSLLRLQVAMLHGASRPYVFARVALMDAMPQILDGTRIAISLALVLALVSEIMLGATSGLGTRVNDSLAGYDLPTMYALVVTVGVLGWALNLLGTALAARFIE